MAEPYLSLESQKYIAEKLAEHRQAIVDEYGSSKVPTPVVSHLYERGYAGSATKVEQALAPTESVAEQPKEEPVQESVTETVREEIHEEVEAPKV